MSLSLELYLTSAFHQKVEALRQALSGERVNPVLIAAAQPVVNSAKAKCPVLTGTLRRSIEARIDADGGVIVGSDVPYAARIEFGFAGADSLGRNYHQAAKPYLRPAIAGSVNEVREAAADALRAMIRSM